MIELSLWISCWSVIGFFYGVTLVTWRTYNKAYKENLYPKVLPE